MSPFPLRRCFFFGGRSVGRTSFPPHSFNCILRIGALVPPLLPPDGDTRFWLTAALQSVELREVRMAAARALITCPCSTFSISFSLSGGPHAGFSVSSTRLWLAAAHKARVFVLPMVVAVCVFPKNTLPLPPTFEFAECEKIIPVLLRTTVFIVVFR